MERGEKLTEERENLRREMGEFGWKREKKKKMR